jgi:hypothetical protein
MMPMGVVVRFPNCREISPEASQLIARRTEKAAYWVRRWSEINKRLSAAPNAWDNLELQDASLHILGWLYERNLKAPKARGF